MAKETYHKGKIGALLQMTVGFIKRDPSLLESPERLVYALKRAIPELNDKSRCPNCDASMSEYEYTFDRWDTVLLVLMAQEVRERQRRGIDFTEANRVHVPSAKHIPHTAKCRTTKASKLGLVAKAKYKGRQMRGYWVITRRGWQALAGDPVPKHVRVWRGKIEARFDAMTTLDQVINQPYKPGVNNKVTKTEYDGYVQLHGDNSEYYQTVTHQGKLFPDAV